MFYHDCRRDSYLFIMIIHESIIEKDQHHEMLALSGPVNLSASSQWTDREHHVTRHIHKLLEAPPCQTKVHMMGKSTDNSH